MIPPRKSDNQLDGRRVAALRRRLFRWYRRDHRKLPWRKLAPSRSDPYHVLVSEAMLQQTQVATVVDYFRRFVARWPTIGALAAADEQHVLRLWQGLGYYRRAQHLHEAARRIVRDYGGKVPASTEELTTLPGVGRYTAAAIASIAFGRRTAVLDGNVARVLARWFNIEEPVDQTKTRSNLWRIAEQLVPENEPGQFNEAIMELGAVVCVPRQPKCLLCPVAASCQANLTGRTSRLPVVGPRTKPRCVEHHVIGARKGNLYLFEQRAADGMWSKMWQLPTAEQIIAKGELKSWFAKRFGLLTVVPENVATFIHQTTHRTIRIVLWRTTVQSGRLRPRTGLWRKLDAIDDLPLANPQRKALALLRQAATDRAAACRRGPDEAQ